MTEIRSAQKSDVDELLRLDMQAFPDLPMTKTYFIESITYMAYQILVIGSVNGPLDGFISLFVNQRTPNTIQIGSLAIDANKRRMGLGGALFERSFVLARQGGFKSLELVVWPQNTSAISLYKKMGLRPIETIPDYYTDGEPRCRMSCNL